MSEVVDSQLFRGVLSRFATGVIVVGFMRQGQPCGMTVNSFSSVSLDPPLILFCPALTTRFALEVGVGEPFTVSILSAGQADICQHFAGGVCCECDPWMPGAVEPPVIASCLGWLRCRASSVMVYGDHQVVIGAVEEYATHSDDPPLLFFRGRYPMLEAGCRALLIDGDAPEELDETHLAEVDGRAGI